MYIYFQSRGVLLCSHNILWLDVMYLMAQSGHVLECVLFKIFVLVHVGCRQRIPTFPRAIRVLPDEFSCLQSRQVRPLYNSLHCPKD
jgi:hypothetical protein